MFGAVWIVLHAEAGRAGTHTLFQALAMAECTIALLLRGRKPLGALASILVMYGVTGLDTLLIMPVMFAVATVADGRERRTATLATLISALVVVVVPLLRGDKAGILTDTMPYLAAVIVAAGLGAWVRAHRHPVITAAAGPGAAAAVG